MERWSLRRCVCPNFEFGYVFVGDTAQGILQGGYRFRFDALRDVWFQEFLPSKKPPPVHHLVENFRWQSAFSLLHTNPQAHISTANITNR
jgi:hypothetical protein